MAYGTVAGSANAVYEKLFGWYTTNRRGSATFTVQFDPTTKYNNKPSVKIDVTASTGGEVVARKTNNNLTGWSTSAVGYIPVKGNTVYKVRVAVKTSGVVAAAGLDAFCIMDELQVSKAYIRTDTVIDNISGTTDFTVYELTVTTFSTTRFVDIICGVRDTTGTAWFSDISLTEVDPVSFLPVSGTEDLVC